MSGALQDLRVHAIVASAHDVLLFDLRVPSGQALPAFEPGAHVDLHLPDGVVRSYSLLNDCRERHRYLLAVKREAASRGGSAWLHAQARVGGMMAVAGPKNSFPLARDASHSVLVAGGIGVTPLWCMAQQLQAEGRPWTLHYRAKTRASAALLNDLMQPGFRDHVRLSFSDEPGTSRLDLQAIVRNAQAGTHFYCCGPNAMIQAFEDVCRGIDPAQVHAEHFAAIEAPATDGGYSVRLARSGQVLSVLPGQTILSSLKAHGLHAPSACQQGVCGECETNVLAGVPDHRDLVLTAQERASNRSMMICCSGSLTPELTLDI